MSDIEPEAPTPVTDSQLVPAASGAADPEPTPAPVEASVPDPRDARIADLEAQNLSLRSQVADLTAQIAAPQQAPSDVPSSPVGPSMPPTTPGPAFDVQARTAELLAQGVPEDTAVEQARYEQRTWIDHQNAGVTPA